MFLHEYLRHQLIRARQGAPITGLHNCHVRGLTSIVFHNDTVGLQRIFIANRDHELYRNSQMTFGSIAKDQSLAFHRHHCDITLIPVFGTMQNVQPDFGTRAKLSSDVVPGVLAEYKYTSAIRGKEGGLKPTGYGRRLWDAYFRNLRAPLTLPAKQYHTVYVPKGESAAWIVFEGMEDPKYKSACYTFNPVFDASLHYTPMTQEEIIVALEKVLFSLPSGR